MKKMLCMFPVALALLLTLGAYASIAVSGSLSALVSEAGETLVEPGVYEEIIPVSGTEYFAAYDSETGGYALMNPEGALLTEPVYSSFVGFGQSILYQKDGLFGVMDSGLQILIPAQYTWIVDNGAGGYLALRTDIWDDTADGVYLIDESGYMSPTGVKVASLLMPFSQGLSPALSTENGRYGYLNAEGQWEIRPQYAYADEFENGLAVATLDSGAGVIDAKGNWLVMPRYDYVDIGDGENALIAAVSYQKGITAYRASDCTEAFSLDSEVFGAYVALSGNEIFVYMPEGVRALNEKGQEILFIEGEGYLFSGGQQIIVFDGEWGKENAYLVNRSGETVSGSYDDIIHFQDFGGKSYFIVNSFEDSALGDFRSGLIDGEGRELFPAEYRSVSMPKEGYALLEDDAGVTLVRLPNERIWQHSY